MLRGFLQRFFQEVLQQFSLVLLQEFHIESTGVFRNYSWDSFRDWLGNSLKDCYRSASMCFSMNFWRKFFLFGTFLEKFQKYYQNIFGIPPKVFSLLFFQKFIQRFRRKMQFQLFFHRDSQNLSGICSETSLGSSFKKSKISYGTLSEVIVGNSSVVPSGINVCLLLSST